MKPRRWFRFTLRTFFVLLTLVCVWLGWLGVQWKWIRERRAFLAAHPHGIRATPWPGETIAKGPGLLWIFGEKGYTRMGVVVGAELPTISEAEVLEVRRLFPETIIHVYDARPRKYPRDRDMGFWNPGEPWKPLPPPDYPLNKRPYP